MGKKGKTLLEVDISAKGVLGMAGVAQLCATLISSDTL